VLNDNRNIGIENQREIGVARNRRRLCEVVKAQMQRAPRRYRNPVGADRIAVGKMVSATWASLAPAFSMQAVS